MIQGQEQYDLVADALIKRMIHTNAIRSAHKNQGHKLVFAVTGGGTNLPNRFARIEGASSTFLGSVTPYHQALSNDLIGVETMTTTPSAVSREMALSMARRVADRTAHLIDAYEQQANQPESNHWIWGVALTAAVHTSRKRRGPDRLFIAIACNRHAHTHTIEVVFERDTWTRDDQNLIGEWLALNLIVDRLHATDQDFFGANSQAPQIVLNDMHLPGKLFSAEKQYDLSGNNGAFTIRPTQYVEDRIAESEQSCGYLPPYFNKETGQGHKQAELGDTPLCYVPSSINPLTACHRWMCDVIRARGLTPVIEITDNHPDKGTLSRAELVRRIRDCLGREHVRVSTIGYFADKVACRSAKERTFAIGIDVAEKLLNTTLPRYLDDLKTLAAAETTFLVFSRTVTDSQTGQSQRKTLSDLVIPPEYRHLFIEIDRASPDGSSTEVRTALGIQS